VIRLWPSVSDRRHEVVLDDEDGRVFSPERVLVAIRTSSPSTLDESRMTYQVNMRFHPQVGLNTRLTRLDGGQMIVRGYENVGMRSIEINLLCEEVVTP